MAKVLFFIKGTVPTQEELESAKKIGTKSFRNVQYATPEQPLEICAGVSGCAPDHYRAKYTYIEVPKIELKKLEEKPPVNPTPTIANLPPIVTPTGLQTPMTTPPPTPSLPWMKT